ncbi:MAG: hypothetical protein INQ03_16275 [Candidatus Heimdallarchaeota archaeon]|nr:hypothetical protein [Candidatus Heimdallarchaeota archaeon]
MEVITEQNQNKNFSSLNLSWLIISTEFKREFLKKRTIGFLFTFTFFTGLILTILNSSLEETEQTMLNAELWTYSLGNIALAFFAGLVGIAVSAYLGGQLLVKDLVHGPVRLINSYPVSRFNIYFSRIINGALLYLPLSIIASIVVMTIGVNIGSTNLDIPLEDFYAVYGRVTLAVTFIVFVIGFLSATVANLIGMISGSETQGVVLTVVLLAFGDIIVSILSSFVPDWNLERFSIGYHRAEVFYYLLQVAPVSAGPGNQLLQSTSVELPLASFVVLMALPVIIALLGYLKFKRMDLE